MADDKDGFERRPDMLAGEIAALRALLTEIAGQLPERAMFIVAQAARDLARHTQADADRLQTDPARDFAVGTWDICDHLAEALDRQIDEISRGSRIRTVQPYPIHPSDQVDPRGF